MRVPFRPLLLVLTLALGAAGCAAPIKALMETARAPEMTTAGLAEVDAPAPETGTEHAALRIALDKQAAAMRAGMLRKPEGVTRSADLPARLPDARLPTGKLAPEQGLPTAREVPQPADRVKAMLAKVRGSDGATRPGTPAPLEGSPLSTRFEVKSEVKLAALGASMPMPEVPIIRFADTSTILDAAGNRTLAALIGTAENPLDYRLIVTGGLAGPGQPWEKMQLASARMAALANHVPPPMLVERRFDPGLDLADVRLDLVKRRR